MFQITVNPEILDRLDELQAALDGCEPVIGEAAKSVLMDHLADKENGSHPSASRLGATPTGTYAEMAESIAWAYSPGSVSLAIQHAAAAQRFYGGTIKPTGGKKYLTIPAQAKSYGKSLPGDFEGPFAWLYGRNGLYAVAEKDKADSPLFFLVKSVTQSPDPTLLPDDEPWKEQMINTLLDAIAL